MTTRRIGELAAACGFELAGVTPAQVLPEQAFHEEWCTAGYAGAMTYLTDHRAGLRADPRNLLPEAQSVIVVGKLYNGPQPYSTQFNSDEQAWISRYAWGDDYHVLMRDGLNALAAAIRHDLGHEFHWRACVDTAPLMERALARRAGLGWLGRNSCLINQQQGSWFLLGELLVSLDLAPNEPAPDRCGTCTRCIDACPTTAIVPLNGRWTVDSRRCISYFTIEVRGPVPEDARPGLGNHVFGCDICQDVCPWNRRATTTTDPAFTPRAVAPPLARLAALSEHEFREVFRDTPVWRARYRGFLRNVAIAMGNSGSERFAEPLATLAASPDDVVAEAAQWALRRCRDLDGAELRI